MPSAIDPGPVLVLIAPDSAPAESILRAYFADVVGRYWGREVTANELERALREDPSDDLRAPTGLLVVADTADGPVGCGGVRFLADGIAELTRVFVRSGARQRGTGARIVAYLEEQAVVHGRAHMRLDTRSDLIEARAMYARLGYAEVPAFNSDPHAQHWFEKPL